MECKTCCFMGHSETPADLYGKLLAEIERHITAYGVRRFLVGNLGGFDRMAACALQEAKQRHEGLCLLLALAYPPTPRTADRPDAFDGIWFPAGQARVPRKAAIPRLNQELILASDYAIAYVTHASGGAYKTLCFAEKRQRAGQLLIHNLGEGSL